MLEIYINGEIIVILDIILVLYLEIYHICLIRLVLYLEINIVIVFLTHLDINMSEKDSIKIVWELSVLFELQLYILWIFLAKYFKFFLLCMCINTKHIIIGLLLSVFSAGLCNMLTVLSNIDFIQIQIVVLWPWIGQKNNNNMLSENSYN